MDLRDINAYTEFAEVYDEFMDNVPYDDWCRYLIRLLRKYGVEDGLLLELGCGTGSLTERLADAGYDMIGVDSSSEMLEQALAKRDASGHDILYLNQDMREFELYGTVRAIVSLCDCMSYILTVEDLTQVLRLANNYLDPEGIFIFDLNTDWKYRQVGDSTIAEDREDSSFIWDNSYDEEERINEYDLALFIRTEGDLYRKYTETHIQRAWLPEEIRKAVEDAGMELVAMYDAFTEDEPRPDSERIYVIAREHGKASQ